MVIRGVSLVIGGLSMVIGGTPLVIRCVSIVIKDMSKGRGGVSMIANFNDVMDVIKYDFKLQCTPPQSICSSSSPVHLLFLLPRQLEALTQLMQQSPQILLQLGITPEMITTERNKRDAALKLKVHTLPPKLI